ncbi:MAG: S8 family serine peptidase [Candidatus Sericytochromatia bacterium]|nr:S8 family serine peptidase [Candidatus Sericytochromatia bacterium]
MGFRIQSQQAGAAGHVAGELLLKLKDAKDLPDVVQSFQSARLSLEKQETLTGLQRKLVHMTLKDKSEAQLQRALKHLQKHPKIAYAEPNYLIELHNTPNDLHPSLWGLNNTGQTGGSTDSDIDAPEAWAIETGQSRRITVAIIDSGVDYTHPDLKDNIWTNPGEIAGDGIDNDRNGYIDDIHGWDFANNDNDPMDDHSHGTHCAGTVGARGNNGLGITGVSWNVEMMALKFLSASGSGSTSAAIKALQYATANGAMISNNSWGSTSKSLALQDAIAAAKGHVFIAAAGNNAANSDTSPHYPAAYNLDNIISVAASNHKDQLASFSNYGLQSVDLAAPGSSIYSTVLNHSYGNKSGTSMAAPHVAGVAALLWSH